MGYFNKAVNDLRGIKRNIKLDFLIQIWLTILDSVIGPISFYGFEVSGPVTNQDFTKNGRNTKLTLCIQNSANPFSLSNVENK